VISHEEMNSNKKYLIKFLAFSTIQIQISITGIIQVNYKLFYAI